MLSLAENQKQFRTEQSSMWLIQNETKHYLNSR